MARRETDRMLFGESRRAWSVIGRCLDRTEERSRAGRTGLMER